MVTPIVIETRRHGHPACDSRAPRVIAPATTRVLSTSSCRVSRSSDQAGADRFIGGKR